MAVAIERRTTVLAPWAFRIALCSATLVVAAILLHRFFGMATPVAVNLFALAYVGAAASVLLVIAAAVVIWRNGVRGKFLSVLALAISGGLIAWPLSYLPVYLSMPELNDISTDVTVPPKFATLAKLRGPGANPAGFETERAQRLQPAAYPDIRSINVKRSSEEAYELALEALRRQGLRVVSEREPDVRTGRPGFIEAKDRTLIVGFHDDVVVRIAGDRWRARLDIRSASQYGSHDFGRNAERVRRILKEFQARLEATVGTAEDQGQARRRRGLRNLKALQARAKSRRSRGQRN
ncbi:MAG: hypothetical protein RLZ98_2626 [Pseudomonadota bacterium]|jgi:uncharacterized protein (DUF1499 family)